MSADDAAGELRDARIALLWIQHRDERAWHVAEVLATMWRDHALLRLLDTVAPRRPAVPAFTPTLRTDQELIDVFGNPDEVDRRNRRRRAA